MEFYVVLLFVEIQLYFTLESKFLHDSFDNGFQHFNPISKNFKF